jgi:hypothetical protein
MSKITRKVKTKNSVTIATDEEIKAMEIARAEYARGEFVTLDQIYVKNLCD